MIDLRALGIQVYIPLTATMVPRQVEVSQIIYSFEVAIAREKRNLLYTRPITLSIGDVPRREERKRGGSVDERRKKGV